MCRGEVKIRRKENLRGQVRYDSEGHPVGSEKGSYREAFIGARGSPIVVRVSVLFKESEASVVGQTGALPRRMTNTIC